MSRGRSLSMAEPKEAGLKDAKMRNKGLKMHDKAQWKMNKMAKVGVCVCERVCACVCVRVCER
eukprot:1157637-Pelagomonas_calceolata.AAC.1